jgi:hypothetical protein
MPYKLGKREYILTLHICGHMALMLYRLVIRENIGGFYILKMCNESLDYFMSGSTSIYYVLGSQIRGT